MIYLIPVGGLANRMRAIASAISLAQDCSSSLNIIWFKDKGLNCNFQDIFSLFSLPSVYIREAGFLDLLIYDRPRNKNFHFPKIFQLAKFDNCLYEYEIRALKKDQFDFLDWAKEKKVYIASHDIFYPFHFSLLKNFKPLSFVSDIIEERYKLFTPDTIGIHLRRTDHSTSILKSPTELFIEAMENEVKMNNNTCFYLATDSESDKNLLCKRFPNRIITSEKKVSRSTLDGMREAVADLFLLSRTKKVFGSSQSSFSEIAAMLSDIECMILER